MKALASASKKDRGAVEVVLFATTHSKQNRTLNCISSWGVGSILPEFPARQEQNPAAHKGMDKQLQLFCNRISIARELERVVWTVGRCAANLPTQRQLPVGDQ